MKALSQVPIELIFWIIGLTLLASADMPEQLNEPHFTICPLANSGFHWCPGCGLGRSITALFHGEFYLSIQLHWFGLPAFLILCYRISVLTRLQLKRSWKNNF
jgi:hypothetical protein